MRCLFAAALVCAAASLVGCGGSKPKLVPVNGKVTQKGTGLSAGAMFLHPAPGNPWTGDPPTSQLELDGSFTLATHPYGPGVPPGDWKVTLSSGLAGRIRHPEYGDATKTTLTLKVPDEGVKDHAIEIK